MPINFLPEKKPKLIYRIISGAVFSMFVGVLLSVIFPDLGILKVSLLSCSLAYFVIKLVTVN